MFFLVFWCFGGFCGVNFGFLPFLGFSFSSFLGVFGFMVVGSCIVGGVGGCSIWLFVVLRCFLGSLFVVGLGVGLCCWVVLFGVSVVVL